MVGNKISKRLRTLTVNRILLLMFRDCAQLMDNNICLFSRFLINPANKMECSYNRCTVVLCI